MLYGLRDGQTNDMRTEARIIYVRQGNQGGGICFFFYRNYPALFSRSRTRQCRDTISAITVGYVFMHIGGVIILPPLKRVIVTLFVHG